MSGGGDRTLLAFDYGAKRIGVAVGDSQLGSANALTTLANHAGPDWDAIGALLAEWQPSRVIVGLPQHHDGTPGTTAKACRRFARQLAGRYNLPVDMVDERLTSRDAEQRLRSARSTGMLGRRIRKTDIDRLAAQLILENWLAGGGIEVTEISSPDES